MKAARLVVLGIAIIAGGLAVFLAGRSPEEPKPVVQAEPQIETTDLLVAGRDIAVGQSVTAGDLEWQQWPTRAAGAYYIRKSDRPDAIEQIAGSVARTPFAIGEPIREAQMIKANGSGYMAAILPGGMRAISTEITAETGAGGFILPNDHVDVLLSRRDKQAEKSTGIETTISETIIRNARVLAIDQTIEDKGGQKVVVGKTATLELTPGQTETLALARQVGTISLALRSVVDTAKTATDTEETARQGVNIVRFGIGAPK